MVTEGVQRLYKEKLSDILNSVKDTKEGEDFIFSKISENIQYCLALLPMPRRFSELIGSLSNACLDEEEHFNDVQPKKEMNKDILKNEEGQQPQDEDIFKDCIRQLFQTFNMINGQF